jgi:lysozyme family protein
MANFEIAYKITGGHEGGWVNNPTDRGQETAFGISRKYYPTWNGWLIIDRHKRLPDFPNNLKENKALEEQTFSFYKKNFWDVNKLDQLISQEIANEAYDTGVNMGYRVAAEFIQRSYNLLSKNGSAYSRISVDGDVGPKTIKAVNEHPRPDRIAKTMNILQGAKYVSICEKDPTQEVFFSGWLERVGI